MTSAVIAVLLVAPQPRAALGSELLALAAVSGMALFILDRRAGHATDPGAARFVERYSPRLIPAAVASLVGGVVSAWPFLVEVTSQSG